MSVSGISGAQAAPPQLNNPNNGLDSDAFLQMLMVQMNNQDPTAPMDTSQMVTQLSDLTMMTGMTEMQSAVGDLGAQIYSSQALYASALVGKEIMVLANVADLSEGQTVEGEILLQASTDELTINVYDENDNVVATLPMGAQKSGQIEFDLSDLDEPLPEGKYRLEAIASFDGKETEVAIVQRTSVNSVVMPGNGQEILIEAEGIGLVPLSYIMEIQGAASGSQPEMASNPYFRQPALQAFSQIQRLAQEQ
ncbi:flagellar hook assembly protein FlgD [Endozoicomonas ascidiicola]|uniref:flagellar hook assembly protein FlgD n=1 Tax=Endozoicomonas ascidiicola TaxID=1698521 RepID=UPI000833B0D9|nr:flagellar hook capping FlgD N-terminal domain-containing protein [Endozoicomonas ascidiicola]